MSSSKENCQNCSQTFYTQSLFPIELVDFKFGGERITLIGCFVNSSSANNSVDCPKVCHTCLELLRTSFVGNEHTLTKRPTFRRSFHTCITCLEFLPASVMMNMNLTVANFNGQSIKLIDCYKISTKKELIDKEGNKMVCLACVSAIIDKFRDCEERVKIPDIKLEADCPEVEQEMGQEETPEDHPEISLMYEPHVEAVTAIECKTDPELDIVVKPILEEPISLEPPKFESNKKRQRVKLKKLKNENRSFGEAFIECANCGIQTRKGHLERHFISKHYRGRYYACHHCIYYKSLTKQGILSHLMISHFQGHHKCPQCSRILASYRKLQNHMKKHQAPVVTRQCDGCKAKFMHQQSYNLHMEANPLLFHCTECGAGYHTVRAMDRHMEQAHKKVYTCPICQLPLHLAQTYATHMWKQHGVRTKPRCRFCGKEFETTAELSAHRQTEHKPVKAKNVVCEVCGKKYDTEYKLVQHIQATHKKKSTVELFQCTLCPKQYKNKISIQSHHRRVHLNENKDNTKMYPCTKCSLMFVKRQYLEGHMISHNTENRPFFQCMQCGIAYTRRQKLEAHKTKNKCPNRIIHKSSTFV